MVHKKKKVKRIRQKTKKISKKKSFKKKSKKPSVRKLNIIVNKRVSMGIKELDKLMEKGFEYSSNNLVVGGSGSGKSIFTMQFLIEGINKGENVLYITFEESKEEFYENMKEIGWDLQKYENSGKLTFLEYSPEKIKMMLDEGGGAIESIVYKNKIKRLVIDSLSSFSSLFDDSASQRQGILSLFDIIQKWDCTSLFTLQNDPIKNKNAPSSQAEIQSDSIIVLYLKKIGNKRERFLEILKMRGTKHSNQIYPFTIGKNGIKVSSRPTSVKF